jgi:hypothetical protein
MSKVLVACPTADVKNYCFDRWLSVADNLTYEDYDLHLCDNSVTRDFYMDCKTNHSDKLTIDRVVPVQGKSIASVMAQSHDKCRQKVLREGYEWLLHLESDVFPPLNVIERLMDHHEIDKQKRVIGALYHIDLGEQSKLMVQEIEGFGNEHRETLNLDESDVSFVDGTVKRVFSCGLGCVLIHRTILEKIVFRHEEGAVVHPDSFFYGDLDALGVPVFVDTSIYCEHDNKSMTRI